MLILFARIELYGKARLALKTVKPGKIYKFLMNKTNKGREKFFEPFSLWNVNILRVNIFSHFITVPVSKEHVKALKQFFLAFEAFSVQDTVWTKILVITTLIFWSYFQAFLFVKFNFVSNNTKVDISGLLSWLSLIMSLD